jgi:UDP-N-acetylglucosamine diphosphorylase / glucose-1-phosphate thymidylyltransferase / UDP-N-acetylgalactosamine diphosphorylase / glucosamine-1-phosphate N-acetyltransferase / galactosamine-1-phosphate N-acetyltransferase
MMAIVVFEDQQCELLAPITLARLASTITCASFRLLDLLQTLDDDLYGIVRPHLTSLQRIDFPQLKSLEHSTLNGAAHDQPVRLLLNARLAPTATNYAWLRKLISPGVQNPSEGAPRVVMDRDQVAAVINPPWSLHDLYSSGYLGSGEWLDKASAFPTLDIDLQTISLPHELIGINMACFRENMELRMALTERELIGSPLRETSDGVFVAEGASIGAYVLCDTKNGPIIIDQGAEVGPYTLLRGPLYIGPKTRILEHSAIKDAVSLSHTTKIGGEVEASIVEPYTNKQHHGFLGHSYLGSWINLGAGTCNSDLKNTYGTVNMEYGFGKSQTNMQFLGCIMGDYSKTAINTGIFTGKVIGVCSMMYGFVTSNVPSFVNYARLFGQMASLPPEVMVSTQQRMFARRKVQQRGCDVQLIYDMHRLTQLERDRHGEALAF